MRKYLFLLSLPLLLLFAFAKPAYSMMVELSVEKLSKSSTIVIRGTVQSVKSFWTSDKRLIFTEAQVSITEVIRGEISDSTIFVEYEGGEVKGVVLEVSDSPKLTVGEDIIAFLIQAESFIFSHSVYRINGFAQGKYKIKNSSSVERGDFSIYSPQQKSSGQRAAPESSSQPVNGSDLQKLIDRIKRAK